MKRKKNVLTILVILMVLVCGCGEQAADNHEMNAKKDSEEVSAGNDNNGSGMDNDVEGILSESPLVMNLDNAIELSVNWDMEGNSTLLKEKFSVEKNGKDMEKNLNYSNSIIGYNEEYGFYYRSYIEDMAQYDAGYAIYSYDLRSGESAVLHEIWDAIWVNEMHVSGNYMYWVEYRSGVQGNCYQIMQFVLDTKELKCIAEYNEETMEPCLAVSANYVTWYEEDEEGEAKLVVWNIQRQVLEIIDTVDIDEKTPVTKFMPWERLEIVDDYVTFFTQDKDGNVYVNRYQLHSGLRDIMSIGDKKNYKKVAGCFSNEEYIGWFTEYSVGTVYFYNIKEKQLSKLSLTATNPIFSFALYDKLYINTGREIYIYDISSASTHKYDLNGSGLQFEQYEEEVWVENYTDTKTGVWCTEIIQK